MNAFELNELHRFTTADHMQLEIDGRTELLERMSHDIAARNDPHRLAVNVLARTLQFAFRHLCVQQQDAIAISDCSGRNAPDPDIALTTNPANPKAADVLAVVEVSDSTYTRDRQNGSLSSRRDTGLDRPHWQRRVEKYLDVTDLDLPSGRIHPAGSMFDILGVASKSTLYSSGNQRRTNHTDSLSRNVYPTPMVVGTTICALPVQIF